MTSSYDNPLQRQKRVRLERSVSLKFKNLEGFVTELSENISLGGMFLRTGDPQPVGTLFDFELTLEEEGPLIQGIAEVMWVREADDGPDRPRGMGIRFLELAPGSRALIYQVVDQHIVRGGEPFDLHEPPPREGAPGFGGGGARPAQEAAEGQETGSRSVRAGSYAVLASPQRRLNDELGARETWRTARRSPERRTVALGAAVMLALVLAVLGWALWPESGEEPGSGDPPAARASLDRDPLETVVPARPEPEPEEATSPEEEPPEPSGRVPATEPSPAGRATADPGDKASPEPPEDESEPSREPPPQPEPAAETASAAEPQATEPRAAEPAPASPATATVLRDISWQREGGLLVVTLTADGRWKDGSWDRFRMDEGTPREVIRLRGIREPFRPGTTVGETELRQIRTGHHRRAGGPELHVVLDLSSPRVQLSGIEARGADLRITLEYP